MKKLFVYSICTLASIAFIGCGSNSTDSTIRDLNSQLSHVNSSISSISEQDMSSLYISQDYNNYGYANQNNLRGSSASLYTAKSKVANDIQIQNELTNQINNNIDNIKATLKNNKNKYNKNQIKAIKNLTGQLSTYASKIKNSKDEVKGSMKIINYNQNINHMSLDQLSAGYNGISNVLETRKAYYYNVLNTLSQIQSILNGNTNFTQCDNCNNKNNNENSTPRKNINIPDNTNQNNNQTNVNQNNVNQNNANNITPNYNNVNPYMQNYYPPYAYNYNNAYGFNNGFMGYGFNGYGYNGMNPTRNTDTYRPFRVNIDTYRFSPNGNGVVNNGVMPVSVENNSDIIGENDTKKVKELNDLDLNAKPDNSQLFEQNKEINKPKHKIKKLVPQKEFSENNDPLHQVTWEKQEKYKRLNNDDADQSYTKPIKTIHHLG